MNNDGAKKRVGYIRFYGLNWKLNSGLIKEMIGRENIVGILQAQEDGKDLDAHDLVFVNPDFDEIDEGGQIPLYSYNFSTGEFLRSE